MPCELTERIRTLEAEAKDLRSANGWLKLTVERRTADLDKMRLRRDKMVALCSYASHKGYCAFLHVPAEDCDCGFSNVLNGEDEAHANLCTMKAHVDGTPPEPLLTSKEVARLIDGKDTP